MATYNLSKQQARLFLLHHQKLTAGALPEGKQSVYEYVRHVGCIQYDPLSIAGHNHELVLQARIPGFTPVLAQELLYKDRLLVDGWDKNMSIYCTEDWPCFQRRRELSSARMLANTAVMSAVTGVREELRDRGPLSSLDLQGKEKVDWAWAPARLSRAALESLYFTGELAIHHRIHTRRYYDFAAKLLPAHLIAADDPNKTDEQYHDWYVLRRIGSIGLQWNKSGDGWLGIHQLKSKERTASILRLLAADKLREVRVEGVKMPLYMRSMDAPVLEAILAEDQVPLAPATFAAAMAPLDNLLWDRELIRQLFGFHYRWEVYKPAAEREYGYYILPLLYGDRFVARLEPVMDKKSGTLNIVRWWWEPGESLREEMIPAIQKALSALARCTQASSIAFQPEVIHNCGLKELEANLIL
ncbi:AlkZ family DNA glycosylase [Paenibacillus albidus]|uniref:winged helix-turn-helix domain-containing protein n=1 Tax=Paenibacillus albidus TaxID=2041023 RepID=UPI001BEC4A89|nr:winged helix DNA-binding domain-containing protein [Paenibacillus albidus]MBT2293396.1 AlkZ family DNA glycosylase [Paenibacillus albidus]